MCLAIPAQITKLLADQRALVNIGGIEKEISISLLEEVFEGDYVILHVGHALTRLNEQEAHKTLQLFKTMLQGAE